MTGDPVKYDPATRTFTFDSDLTALIGQVRKIEVRSKLTSYPTITNTQTFTVTFGNKCKDPVTFTSVSQTDQVYTYDGTNKFTLKPFTINPTECGITYATTSIKRKDSSTHTGDLKTTSFTNNAGFSNVAGKELKLNAPNSKYTDSSILPGRYILTITGTATDSSKTQTATINIWLKDPCNEGVTITAPTYVAQNLVIAKASSYTTPAFSISPSYCTF